MSQIIINGQPLYQADLPEMTLAEWQALPVVERPKEWIRTDAEYTDIPAENVSYGSGSVKDALDVVDLTSIFSYNTTYITGGIYAGNYYRIGNLLFVYIVCGFSGASIPDGTPLFTFSGMKFAYSTAQLLSNEGAFKGWLNTGGSNNGNIVSHLIANGTTTARFMLVCPILEG